MSEAIGERLVRAVEVCERELLLVSPYIKLGALDRLLQQAAPVVSVRVVTRWRLEELAIGVNDLEVWSRLRNRRGTELWLNPSLHAKYYRADARVLVGSANLTGAGMGWSVNVNLETLIDVTDHCSDLSHFELDLWRAATRVDDELYETFRHALGAFPAPPPAFGPAMTPAGETVSRTFANWRPCLRFPEDLLRLYSGVDDGLTLAGREAATSDLQALSPPPGLGPDAFRAWIGVQLLQHREVQAIDAFGQQARRFGEMRKFLSQRGSQNAERDWQTWMRWLTYFLPDRYEFRVANYSEIFRVRNPRSGG